jgi:hypothetical protein
MSLHAYSLTISHFLRCTYPLSSRMSLLLLPKSSLAPLDVLQDISYTPNNTARACA